MANVETATAFDRRMLFEDDGCCDPFDLLTPPASPSISGRCSPNTTVMHCAMPLDHAESTDFFTLGLHDDQFPQSPMALSETMDTLSTCFEHCTPLELTPPASPMGSGRCTPVSSSHGDLLDLGFDFVPVMEMDDSMSYTTASAPSTAPSSPTLGGHDLPAWAAALSAPFTDAPDLAFLDAFAEDAEDGPSRKRARTHAPATIQAAKPKRKPRATPAMAAAPLRRAAMPPATVTVPALTPAAQANAMRQPMSAITQKRDQHNVSERMRRQGLKLSFEELRCAVPSLESQPTAHTGQILEGAVALIRQLQQQEAELIRAKAELIRSRQAFAR